MPVSLIALAALLLHGGCVGAVGLVPGAVSVRDYGAVGDGSHDDTAAFQAAIDHAAGYGGTVFVDPVKPGGGYVLTHTVVLKKGVSLVGSLAGMPFIAWEGVPRKIQTGPVILARPKYSLGLTESGRSSSRARASGTRLAGGARQPGVSASPLPEGKLRPDQYTGARHEPLFDLKGGNTIRGLYILYDRQPWPSDKEFADPASPYHYASEADLVRNFIHDHVAPCGPTIYVEPGVASTTIEDITCGRYYDFFYTPAGGKIVINRCYLYGYGRAFAMRTAPDTVRITEIHVVPNVEGAISWQHSKLQAAISSQPNNIVFDFGNVAGYSISDVTAFVVHTGVKLGASPENPFVDPVTGEKASFPWGEGPWGSIQNVKIDNCAVGFDCVTGTILPNQLSNIMVHVSLTDGRKMATTAGSVARQAAFLVEPGFAGATLQISNLSLSSFAPKNVAANAAMVQTAGGRAFLIDCPGIEQRKDYAERLMAHLDIFGLVVSNIPSDHMIALTKGTRPGMVRAWGYTHNGVAQPDGALGAVVAPPGGR